MNSIENSIHQSIHINPPKLPEDFDTEHFKKIWFQSFNLGEKPPLLIEWKKAETREVIPFEWEEPPVYSYVMGVDTYPASLDSSKYSSAICIMRVHDNHIEYINTFTDESEYEREVARLSEYYKCTPIREGDYTANTRK